MAITAKFDLETQQMDAINAFVHRDLDETVSMKMPPGFEQQGQVLRIIRTQTVTDSMANKADGSFQELRFSRNPSRTLCYACFLLC